MCLLVGSRSLYIDYIVGVKDVVCLSYGYFVFLQYGDWNVQCDGVDIGIFQIVVWCFVILMWCVIEVKNFVEVYEEWVIDVFVEYVFIIQCVFDGIVYQCLVVGSIYFEYVVFNGMWFDVWWWYYFV